MVCACLRARQRGTPDAWLTDRSVRPWSQLRCLDRAAPREKDQPQETATDLASMPDRARSGAQGLVPTAAGAATLGKERILISRV